MSDHRTCLSVPVIALHQTLPGQTNIPVFFVPVWVGRDASPARRQRPRSNAGIRKTSLPRMACGVAQ
jgi:hypothetical protein